MCVVVRAVVTGSEDVVTGRQVRCEVLRAPVTRTLPPHRDGGWGRGVGGRRIATYTKTHVVFSPEHTQVTPGLPMLQY